MTREIPEPIRRGLWPIPSSFEMRLGILARQGLISEEALRVVPRAAAWAAATHDRSICDPFNMSWVDGQWQASRNGTPFSDDAFAMMEIAEVALVARAFEDVREFASRDVDFERRVLETKLQFEKQFRKEVPFHGSLPRSGQEYFRWHTWEVSCLCRMFDLNCKSGGMFGAGNRTSATIVYLYRYPSDSIEVTSAEPMASARWNDDWGAEIILNGSTLMAMEDLALTLCSDRRTCPVRIPISARYASGRHDLPEHLRDCGRVADLPDEAALAQSIVSMPLDVNALRVAAMLRNFCALLCLYHEEGHLALGHISYLETYRARLRGERVMPRRFGRPRSLLPIEDGAADPAGPQRLWAEYVLNDDVTQIMELQADVYGLDRCLTVLGPSILCALAQPSRGPGGSPDPLVRVLIASLYASNLLVSNWERHLQEGESRASPAARVRLFGLLYHLVRICTEGTPGQWSPCFDGDDARDIPNLAFFARHICKRHYRIIDWAFRWRANVEASTRVELGMTDKPAAIKRDLVKLVESQKDTHPPELETLVAREYVRLCSAFKSRYARIMVGEYSTVQMGILFAQSLPNDGSMHWPTLG